MTVDGGAASNLHFEHHQHQQEEKKFAEPKTTATAQKVAMVAAANESEFIVFSATSTSNINSTTTTTSTITTSTSGAADASQTNRFSCVTDITGDTSNRYATVSILFNIILLCCRIHNYNTKRVYGHLKYIHF